MVEGQALLVALAHLGEDVDPGFGLHAVVGLDVQCPLGLDDLEHLRARKAQVGTFHWLLNASFTSRKSIRENRADRA